MTDRPSGIKREDEDLLHHDPRDPSITGEPSSVDAVRFAADEEPPYNFVLLPTVVGPSPQWCSRIDQPIVTGVRSDRHEVLVTELLDAAPDHRTELPGPSIFPLLVSLGAGVTFTSCSSRRARSSSITSGSAGTPTRTAPRCGWPSACTPSTAPSCGSARSRARSCGS